MTDPHRDAARGAQAEALLSNELLKEAFETLDREYTRAWRTTGAKDTDNRERLWQAVQIVEKVRRHLEEVIINGKIAEKDIEKDIENLGQRKKVFGLV